MVFDTIILFISIVNFILTLFVFLNAKELKQHISFLVFAFMTTIWLLDDFLLTFYPVDIFNPLSYGLGILVATSALVWVYNLIGEKLSFFVKYCILPLSGLVFLVSSFSYYVVFPVTSVTPFGYNAQKGVLFPEYSLYIAFLIIFSCYNLAKGFIQAKDNLRKKQIFSVLVGSLIFGPIAFITGFAIPLFFNSFELDTLVCVGCLPLVISIAYSITKHNLFGVKIIMTQLLVMGLLSLLILNFLFSSSLNSYLWSGFLLVIASALSYFIMKSVFNEIKQKNKILMDTQKSLDAEKKLHKDFLVFSEETIKKLEDNIS